MPYYGFNKYFVNLNSICSYEVDYNTLIRIERTSADTEFGVRRPQQGFSQCGWPLAFVAMHTSVPATTYVCVKARMMYRYKEVQSRRTKKEQIARLLNYDLTPNQGHTPFYAKTCRNIYDRPNLVFDRLHRNTGSSHSQ